MNTKANKFDPEIENSGPKFPRSPKAKETIVIINPGFSGKSSERYTLEAMKQMWQKDKIISLLANRRGMADHLPHKGPTPFSWLRYDDLDEIIDYLNQNYDKPDIFLLGFSLGACSTINYLSHKAREKEETGILAAIAISPPWGLKESQVKISKFPKLEKRVLEEFVEIMDRQRDSADLIDFYQQFGVKPDDLLKYDKLYDLQNNITCKFYGFDKAEDYYEAHSVFNHVGHIEKRTLLITSLTDPVVE